MKGYKGFSKGLVCRGKQYEENTVFEEAKAEICKSGMHFCENPFNVLDHYGFVNEKGEFNEFAEVEALDDVSTDDNKKYCTTKLKIGAKLSFSGFVKAKKGSWITLSEWEWKGDKYTPICVRTEYVDGENIKADTWYKLVGGKFIEV